MGQIKIINLSGHFDTSHFINQWVKKIPLNIKYSVYAEYVNGKFLSKYGLWELDCFEDINVLPNRQQLKNETDENTIVICFSPKIYEIAETFIEKTGFKKVFSPHGSLAPPTNKILTHSNKYLSRYNCGRGLFIPKIYNYRYTEIPTEERKNFYSYIRNYDTHFSESYLKFRKLHSLIRQSGIALVNYGWQNDTISEFDVPPAIYMPKSKGTVHLKFSDLVSNSVCRSIYHNTPVLMLRQDYENGWLDSINGIKTFDTVEEIADFMIRMETDATFFKELVEYTTECSKQNRIMTDEMIQESIRWINNILEGD